MSTKKTSKIYISISLFEPANHAKKIKRSLKNSLLLLLSKNQEPLALNRQELLLPRLSTGRADNELSIQNPVLRDAPGLTNALVDEGVVVLEVTSETLSREGGPEGNLVRADRLGGPVGEFVGVGGEGGLLAYDGGGVGEEEDLGGLC